ncbi:MAG TPA: spondin domain-containing protein [Gemmatimonadales bacterium]|nr:spondin domain-containing protein [Gemmatimonadales bacterium]
MLHKTWRFVALASAVLIAAACSKKESGMSRTGQASDSGNMGSMSGMSGMSAMSDSVEYTIVLKSSWTKARFPLEYPEAGTFTGPHFSGLIGAAHNSSYAIFTVGSRPTAGLEKLSEEGKHAPLDSEIRKAIESGAATSLVESGPLRNFGDSLVATVRVDANHPLLSLVAMIAPSPDWFTGVSNVNLRENGEWVASRSLDLWAYDSGGDDGMTYKAADQDNNPKKPTEQSKDRHFAPKGMALAVGTVTITRK